MSEICVIYASEDEKIVETFVILLRRQWQVWWAKDIASGDWERAVRTNIGTARAVVPVVSPHTEVSDVFRDELGLATRQGKKLFPFVIAKAELPLGFGMLHRTDALGWSGDGSHPAYLELVRRIAAELRAEHLARGATLTVRGKTVRLPALVFSLSSHETQLDPLDGTSLLEFLVPPACLLSAYDVRARQEVRGFLRSVDGLRRSNAALFLDSGNYEAYRRRDLYDRRKNKDGWRREHYVEIARRVSPDVAFGFDYPDPTGSASSIAGQIIAQTKQDQRDIAGRDFPVCPIVHLPGSSSVPVRRLAAQIVAKVAKGLDPPFIAIPERELGDGIIDRALTVREIRKALDLVGKYYPLHLLGTANPISMLILSLAGADLFDGLEWCRTAADWDAWRLFHFQHFDFFREDKLGRLPGRARTIVENKDTPYSLRVACYNVEVFMDWTREIQERTGTPGIEVLMRLHVPGIGERLYRELFQ